MPNDVSIDSIDKVYDIPDSVEAPVKEGQKLGTLTLSYANQKIAEIDLLAGESVDRSELLSAVAVIKEIVSSNWFITVFIVICSLVLIYFIIAAVYNKRKNSSRAVKKKRKF
jgi:D-alanyl-D-alanine carboxypeptidase (penicillin-binding protein 5/6)